MIVTSLRCDRICQFCHQNPQQFLVAKLSRGHHNVNYSLTEYYYLTYSSEIQALARFQRDFHLGQQGGALSQSKC